MAGNWMDDRERMIREREGRGLDAGPRTSREEDRSWDGPGERDDEVFGVRQSGVSYGGAGARPYRQGSAARGWQDPNYGGVSPAMRDGGGYGRGRFQGGDSAAPDYRTGGRGAHGDQPAGYDAGAYSPTRARYHEQGYGRSGYGGYDSTQRERAGEDRGERFEDAGRSAGEFLHRAGEKMASWFNAGGEGRIYDRDYLDPTPRAWRGRETGAPERGARGLGPSGYKRSDERINDDAHERLTDDTWLDASKIGVSVSGGEITLSGTVENRAAKHHAEHLVEDLSGVTHVQNNLRVAKGNPLTTPGRGYGDSVLGAQIRSADAAADDPVANGTGGAGGGQSTAGRKN